MLPKGLILLTGVVASGRGCTQPAKQACFTLNGQSEFKFYIRATEDKWSKTMPNLLLLGTVTLTAPGGYKSIC